MMPGSTSEILGLGAEPMPTPLSAEEFAAACRELVQHHSGHELHRKIDLLVTEQMRSLGFGEGMEIFLAHALPYHEPNATPTERNA